MPAKPPQDNNRSQGPAPLISLITICGNRLHHLQQTLPQMVAQSRTEVIVVAYACTQGTGDWVEQNFPQVTVVRVEDAKGFCTPAARNRGAAVARGKYLLFVDADIVLDSGLSRWIAATAKPNQFYRAHPDQGYSAWGTCLCSRKDFERIGGYDEAYRRWGGEDVDFYARLTAAGATQGRLPNGCLRAIEHGDDERLLAGANVNELNIAYRIYQQAKEDVTKLRGQEPELRFRANLLETIIQKVLHAVRGGTDKPFHIELMVNATGSDALPHLRRVLAYTLDQALLAAWIHRDDAEAAIE